jgi:diguanylate cyclase (GGDEF)-like protein
MWSAIINKFYTQLPAGLYAKYRQHYLAADIKQSALGIACVALPILLFGYSDYLLFGLTQQFYLLLFLRASLLVIAALVIFFMLSRVRGQAQFDMLMMLYGLVFISSCIYIGATRPVSYTHYAVVNVAILMVIYLFFPVRLSIKIILAAVLSLGDLLAMGLLKAMAVLPIWNVTLVSYLMVNGTGLICAARMEYYRRRQFLDNWDQYKLRDELTRLASVDELTGIWNRRKFMELAEGEADRYVRYGRPYSLMMLDLDEFKTVNDRFGHFSGDFALKQFTGVVCGKIRGIDIFGRLGGEEFGIALPETGLAEATVMGERICKALKEHDIKLDDNLTIRLTVSIGVAEACPGHSALDEVISLADTALYRAKAQGRDCLVAADYGSAQSRLEL